MTHLRSYIIGFVLSIALTFAAFWLVTQGFSQNILLVGLVTLAVAQLWVQLICFLHLGDEKRPRWHAITLAFAAFVVVVLVGGSIWIMYHLEQNTHNLSEIYPSGEISPQAQDD